jgi:hypothetical protein
VKSEATPSARKKVAPEGAVAQRVGRWTSTARSHVASRCERTRATPEDAAVGMKASRPRVGGRCYACRLSVCLYRYTEEQRLEVADTSTAIIGRRVDRSTRLAWSDVAVEASTYRGEAGLSIGLHDVPMSM